MKKILSDYKDKNPKIKDEYFIQVYPNIQIKIIYLRKILLLLSSNTVSDIQEQLEITLNDNIFAFSNMKEKLSELYLTNKKERLLTKALLINLENEIDIIKRVLYGDDEGDKYAMVIMDKSDLSLLLL